MKRGQFKLFFKQWVNHFKSTDNLFTLLIAMLIGVLAGTGAWVVSWMIHTIMDFIEIYKEMTSEYKIPLWAVLVSIPALGGAIVGPMIYFFAREAKGHGVPEVMLAVLKKGGKIRPVVGVVKAIASAFTIATGGSVGSEGPIVQIGSSIGSTTGQLVKVPPRSLRTFVGCGAAGGIAAAFNAPIAGALFAVEIILGDFGFAQLTPIVVSSVLATVVSHSLLGDHAFFQIPQLVFENPLELISYGVLGVASALVAVAFIWFLYYTEDLVDDFKAIPEYIKPLLGGLLLGAIGLAFPQVLGMGQNFMETVVTNQMPILLLLGLIGAKLLATCVTLSSGSSGGIFAPSLFLGVLTGKVVGQISNSVIHTPSDSSGAFALVGMAALVGATTHAPITAIMIIFELTNEYRMILPLMITTVIAVSTASRLMPVSIYTAKLKRKGIDLQDGVELNILKQVPVSKALETNYEVIPMDLPINFVVDLIANSSCTHHPVVNEQNQVVGMMSTEAVRSILTDKEILADFVIAADVVNKNYQHINLEQNLDEALVALKTSKYQEIYITEKEDESKIVGVVTRTGLLDAYYQQIMSFEAGEMIASRINRTKDDEILDVIGSYALMQVKIPDEFAGKALIDLQLRKQFHIDVLLLKRTINGSEEIWQPSPHEELVDGDTMLVLGERDTLQKIQETEWTDS